MASFTYRRQLTIEWGQCDPAGIVFNSRFFEIFDTNTWKMFEAALGVKPHELAGDFGIMGIPLVDASANFLKPVKFGDAIEMASRVYDPKQLETGVVLNAAVILKDPKQLDQTMKEIEAVVATMAATRASRSRVVGVVAPSRSQARTTLPAAAAAIHWATL